MQATDCQTAQRDTDAAPDWETSVATAEDILALGRLIREEAARRAAPSAKRSFTVPQSHTGPKMRSNQHRTENGQ